MFTDKNKDDVPKPPYTPKSGSTVPKPPSKPTAPQLKGLDNPLLGGLFLLILAMLLATILVMLNSV